MTLTGDIDRDGQVDQSDLALLKRVLQDNGHSESLLERLSPEDRARLDINGDGVINYDDVVKLLSLLTKSPPDNARALADKFNALRRAARS